MRLKQLAAPLIRALDLVPVEYGWYGLPCHNVGVNRQPSFAVHRKRGLFREPATKRRKV